MLQQQQAMMDASLAQLQLLSKIPPQGDHNNLGEGSSGSKSKTKEDDRSKEENTSPHQSGDP